MPSLGSKKDISKRDMNFFADFTAAAAKMTRFLGYGVVVGVVVVAAIVAVIIYCAIRNMITKAAIDELRATLASPEYSGLEARATELQQELNDYNNYYYVLSQMRKQVDTRQVVSMELPAKIKDAIPSDSYVENYEITQTTLKLDGYTFSYYSALNLVNMLNKSDVFSAPVSLEVSRVAPSEVGSYEDFLKNGINNYYYFTVEGTLTADVFVSVARYAQDGDVIASLGAIETTSYTAGGSYTIDNVATFEQTGITYNLSSVSINNAALSADQVESIKSANQITGIANDNVSIQLYYTAATTEGGES